MHFQKMRGEAFRDLRTIVGLQLLERLVERALEQTVELIVVLLAGGVKQVVYRAVTEALLEINQKRQACIVPLLAAEEGQLVEREEQVVFPGRALERRAVLVEAVPPEQAGVELRHALGEPVRKIAAVDRQLDE